MRSDHDYRGPTRRLGRSASICLLLVVGCQAARVTEPVTKKFGGSDPDQQIEFWHTLAEQPVTSNDDAFHGLLLYLDGEDPATDYAGRLESLRSRQMLPKGFDRPADEAVERGTLAVAITRALDIRGGWAMRVFGPTPRYATRELQYLALYPASSPNQTFTGTEFLGIMGKFEDAQRGTGTPAPATRPTLAPVEAPRGVPGLLNPERPRSGAPDVGPSDR